MVLVILGGGKCQFSQVNIPPTATTSIKAALVHVRRDLRPAAGETTLAASFGEVESLMTRFRSARSSEACWYRRSRSFSKALLMTSSSFGGRSGFSRTGETGTRLRMASKIVAELSPRKGDCPVAISYKTAPKENKSVRASSSLARACSGDI